MDDAVIEKPQEQKPCAYCRGMGAKLIGCSDDWLDSDLSRGFRWNGGTKQYHCYPAYVEA